MLKITKRQAKRVEKLIDLFMVFCINKFSNSFIMRMKGTIEKEIDRRCN